MNFLQMLTFEQPAKRKYERIEREPVETNAQGKYKALLKKPRSIPEIAELLGYTPQGAACTVRRYRQSGLIAQAGTRQCPTGGRPAKLWIWIGQ